MVIFSTAVELIGLVIIFELESKDVSEFTSRFGEDIAFDLVLCRTARGDNLSAQRLILAKVGSLSIFIVISLSDGLVLVVVLIVVSPGVDGVDGVDGVRGAGGAGGAGGGGGGGGAAGALRTTGGIVIGGEIKEALLLFLGTTLCRTVVADTVSLDDEGESSLSPIIYANTTLVRRRFAESM